MLGWFKNWRTRNAGENFARTIVSEIDSYIENVIVPRLTSGLEVFSDILATVWDAPPHDPKEVA